MDAGLVVEQRGVGAEGVFPTPAGGGGILEVNMPNPAF